MRLITRDAYITEPARLKGRDTHFSSAAFNNSQTVDMAQLQGTLISSKSAADRPRDWLRMKVSHLFAKGAGSDKSAKGLGPSHLMLAPPRFNSPSPSIWTGFQVCWRSCSKPLLWAHRPPRDRKPCSLGQLPSTARTPPSRRNPAPSSKHARIRPFLRSPIAQRSGFLPCGRF